MTISRVNQVTGSGQPDVVVGNIPPESSVEGLEITRPEIYFGELSNEYIVVGTDETEFDYPSGDSNQYTQYEGTAGINMNLFNRLVFAINERSFKLLVSSNIDSDSKIIIHRNVMDRIRTIMPYLSYENDSYMVTVDGKLYWMVDAYTTSTNYPYAQPSDEYGTNYIRNSIKVVVDAYNGDVDFYVVDDEDRSRRPTPRSTRSCSRASTRCRKVSRRTSATRIRSLRLRPTSTPGTTWKTSASSTSTRTSGILPTRSTAPSRFR